MRRYAFGLLTLALLAMPLWGQSVTLPKAVEGKANRLLSVPLEYDGDDVRWTIAGDVDVIREYDPDPKKIRLRILAYADGTYELKAVACKDKKLCDFVTCTLNIGKAPVPPVPPGPDPPKPPDPPVPPTPSPTEGKRCMIIFESSEKSKIPEKQLQIIHSTTVHDYLKQKCDPEPDGKMKSWGFFDKDDDLTGYSKQLAKLKDRPRKSLPWLIIGNSKDFFEGPLPADVPAFMELAKKYLETP